MEISRPQSNHQSIKPAINEASNKSINSVVHQSINRSTSQMHRKSSDGPILKRKRPQRNPSYWNGGVFRTTRSTGIHWKKPRSAAPCYSNALRWPLELVVFGNADHADPQLLPRRAHICPLRRKICCFKHRAPVGMHLRNLVVSLVDWEETDSSDREISAPAAAGCLGFVEFYCC